MFIANRVLNESMQVVISRHPSLHDLKYINDVSSVLVVPPILIQDKEEPIYQELIPIDHHRFQFVNISYVDIFSLINQFVQFDIDHEQ